MDDSQIFRVACANDEAKKNLERTVKNGVEEEIYRPLTNIDGLSGKVSIWGVPNRTSTWEDLDKGDYILFYTGKGDDGTPKYGYAGRVQAKETNSELQEELWEVYTRDWGGGSSDDPWDNIIYFSETFPLDLPSAELHGYDGLKKDYIQNSFISFGRNENAHEKIRTDYGSIKAFLEAHRLEGSESQNTSILDTPHTVPENASELERQLRAKHQMVFHGPPGTSKTFTAQQFAHWWLHETTVEPDKEQLRTVTFHPSFTYEDFIEGLTATEGEDGAVQYTVKEGVFQKFATRAREAYENAESLSDAPNYVLIIDEINRGNLAQIFGEIITLLEGDKRLDAENEISITLPHSGKEFYVPPNLYVIGTMNTADRSIALVDAALRRRFRFIHFGPDLEIVCKKYEFGNGDLVGAKEVAKNGTNPVDQLLALSVCAVDALNAEIRETRDLGRGKQLGHTPLLGINGETDKEREQAIIDTWRYELMPLLEEYYFGQFNRMNDELFDGHGDTLFDLDTQEIRNFTADDLEKVCRAIVDDLEATEDESDEE